MQRNRLAPFLLLFLLSAGTCGPGSMKTEETLSQIQREVTVGWVLGHALKHTATHLGHVQLMREMWDKSKSG